MTEIACVSSARKIVLTEDGQILPITNAFDDDGDDCDPEAAAVIVAGPDSDGMWLTIDMRALDKVPVQ